MNNHTTQSPTRSLPRHAMLAAVAAMGAAVALTACTTVSTDYNSKANIAGYHTYALEQSNNQRTDSNRVFNNPLNEDRLRAAVESNLASKGLQPVAVGSAPDCIASISYGSRDVVEGDAYGPRVGFGWGWWHRGFGTSFMYDNSLYAYREHRISIDILDAKTRAAVWHVTADEDINRLTGSSAEARINEIVAKMFAKYPVVK